MFEAFAMLAPDPATMQLGLNYAIKSMMHDRPTVDNEGTVQLTRFQLAKLLELDESSVRVVPAKVKRMVEAKGLTVPDLKRTDCLPFEIIEAFIEYYAHHSKQKSTVAREICNRAVGKYASLRNRERASWMDLESNRIKRDALFSNANRV